jgi:hypothetical protein
MDSAFFRKYADIIETVEQNKPLISESILNEGFLSNIAQKLASKLMGMLDEKTQQAIAMAVKDATGGDYALTADNAMKVAMSLGIDKQDAKAEAEGTMSEDSFGLAGNWQGKLLQAIHSLGVLHVLSNFMGHGVFDSQIANNWVACVGIILLMVTSTFWSSDRDMIGSMGRYGNKGFDTDKGPVSKGY